MWLCVTNDGAMQVCKKALELIEGLPDNWRTMGFSMDPNVGESEDFCAHPGITVRLTRNLDKDRGFVNGAIGVVKHILHYDEGRAIVFTVRLAIGMMVLVHPIWQKKCLSCLLYTSPSPRDS